MRPGQQQNKQRMRGRGRKGPNPLSRSYESNGPDVKIRGTAQHVAEKYLTLARDASASGDRVMAENYLQHAEHYGRIVAAAQGSFQAQRDEREIEYDEDGEEIFDGTGEFGVAQPDAPQPQMRDNRENAPRDNNYPREGNRENGQAGDNRPRENRDRGNREGNRESYNRENRGEREQNREYQARDGQNRDPQNRDNQNRDGQQSRDTQQNRDTQNRDGQNRDGQNRDHQPRDGQQREGQPREQNRENRGNREFNRENREGRGNREFRDNRENRAENQPSGLGPQPFVGLPPSGPSFEAEAQPATVVPDAVSIEAPVEAMTDAPVQGEPRRRGRPRRIRPTEGGVVSAEAAPVEAPAPAAAPVEAPVGDLGAPAPAPAAAGDAPEGEVKAKRRPGRPRKKKPEDDGGDDGGEHLPAFLMASNG